MPHDQEYIQALIAAALEKPAGDERSAYLAKACAGDQELRGQVEALLKIPEEAGPVANEPEEPATPGGARLAWALDDRARGTSEDCGTRIGPDKLLQRLGEGGMGTVWMAEQMEPVRRKVALKVIKPGMDSSNVLARFEAERQALALMDHPNIAKIFDAGVTGSSDSQLSTLNPQLPSGRPYFVMELVKGIPITKFCDEQRLSIRERLELFMPVCQAIQHAHQKGIIHRDIKPSNVLVAQYDGKPVPKVIDFGIAKAMGQQLTERTLFTEFGAIIGTLEYMSPEQAELNQIDIDTRSDIYSLGVLLYQILTGTTPLTRESVQKGALDELLRCIREQEPPKPSTRLSQERVARSAAPGKSEIRNRKSEIDQDLDWIVMKALEKDRSRRYETANGLAMDLQRHLNDEPVLARAPTAAYRLNKFARKHRVAVAAATACASLLIAATVVSARLALWATKEKTKAMNAEADAKAKAAEAVLNAEVARTNAEDAQAVLGFLRRNVLAAARPKGEEGGLGVDVTVRRAVEAAEPKIALMFTNRPTVEAQIRDAVAATFRFLGDYSQAIEQAKRAFDLAKAHSGSNDPVTLACMNNLGTWLLDGGRPKEAIPVLAELLELAVIRYGPKDRRTLTCMNNLAGAYNAAGDLGRAQIQFERVLQMATNSPGAELHLIMTCSENLAVVYGVAGHVTEAMPLLEKVLTWREETYPPNHPSTLTTRENLASCYLADKQFSNAVALLKKALEGRKAVQGPDHPETLKCMDRLNVAYEKAGQTNEAILLDEQALAIRKSKVRLADANTGLPTAALVSASPGTTRLADGETSFGASLSTQDRTIFAKILAQYGESFLRRSNYAAAEPLLRDSHAILTNSQEARLSSTYRVQNLLGWSELGQKRFEEAATNLVQAYEGLKRRDIERPSSSHARLLEDAGERLVQLYEAWGKPEQAAKWRKKPAEDKVSSPP